MRRRYVLWLFAMTFVATAIVSRVAVAPEFAVVSAPIFSDLTLTPGSQFSINITITNFKDLWGYEYILSYNTSVLTATAFSNYIKPDDFQVQAGESWIDDAKGEVAIAVNSYFGDPTGFSTVETQPLTKIDFTIDANGTTVLDIHDSAFVNVYGDPFAAPYNMIEADGKFSNVEELKVHDIAVSSVTASPTEVAAGESVSIEVTVANHGDFTENFTVTVYYNETKTTTKDIDTKTVTDLAIDDSTTLSFTWDTTGVAGGKYAISATANVADEDNPADNTRTGDMVTVKSGAGLPVNVLYIIGGVVILVVVAVGVYALRARKRT